MVETAEYRLNSPIFRKNGIVGKFYLNCFSESVDIIGDNFPRECFELPDLTELKRRTMNIPPLKYYFGFSVLTALFAVCILTVSGFANPLPPLQTVRWETDLNIAMIRAEREQRPLFLHFVGNDSPSAQQMVNEVFVQPNIAAHLNANFVMVKINAVENPALAQRFSVTAIPTDLVMKPNGQIIHQRVGVITADRFSKYLTYLQQEKIPSEREQSSPPPAVAGSSPVVSLPGPFQQAPPSAVATALPPGTMPPQQGTLVSAREPFAQQTPGMQHPPFAQNPSSTMQPPPFAQQSPAVAGAAGAMSSSSATNPLRATETMARPALDQNNASGTPDFLRTSGNMTAPPTASVQPMSDVPAPSKMMVEVPLALEGFCPVTLCTDERWVSGNPVYCTMYQGHIFRFSSMEALATFSRNPANFTPVAMGEDIVLRVDRNRRVNGDRRFGAWYNGRVFLFSSQETFNAFETRPGYYSEIALKYEIARREQSVPIVY